MTAADWVLAVLAVIALAGLLAWHAGAIAPRAVMQDIACRCGERTIRRALTLDAIDARAVRRMLTRDCPGCRRWHTLGRPPLPPSLAGRGQGEGFSSADSRPPLYPLPHREGAGGGCMADSRQPTADSSLTPLNPDMFGGGAPSLPAVTIDPKEEETNVHE